MIKSKHTFHTRTLANLYLSQGYLSDAEKAYRALLENDPARDEDRAILDRIIRMRRDQKQQELALLVKTWADLLRREKKLVRTGTRP